MSISFQQATFLSGAAKPQDFPTDAGAEVAFAGRSNAGKSSALNVLTQQKKLARVSKQPGRTQQINFFQIEEHCRLVDLPGYGYAKVSKDMQRCWQQTLHDYLVERRSLKGLVLLMDCRHPLQEMDLSMLHWAAEADLAIHLVLTKADKFKRGKAAAQLLMVNKYVKEQGLSASVQLFSSLKRQGLETLQQKLTTWLE